MPKVSVIIPVYNVEKYLRECLDSVINQTLKDIEIICVNDGSTDCSSDILQKYEQQDCRIIIIDKQNQGVSVARNTALQKAEGEYVIFMDSDDIYPSNDILETLYTKAVENNAKICGGEFAEFKNDKLNLKQEFSETLYGYKFEKEGFIEYKDYQFDFGHTRFIYNTDFLRENNLNYPLYTRYEDPVFFVKAMILAGQFYAVKKICYGYRILHKPDTWNTTAVCDLLKGILDILTIAKSNSLNNLFKLTETRLCNEFLCRIYANLNNETKPYLDKCVEIIPNTKKYLFKYKIKFFLQSIFSIKNEQINENKYKIFTLLGLKIRLKKNK